MPGNSPAVTIIRPAAAADTASIAAIYNHYVAATIVTFEEEPVSPQEMARRMEEVRSASLPWLVAEDGGEVVGYAYATQWRTRSGYGIALPNEASVALHEKFGLRKVAHFEQVGFKFGRWIDVGYWQGLL